MQTHTWPFPIRNCAINTAGPRYATTVPAQRRGTRTLTHAVPLKCTKRRYRTPRCVCARAYICRWIGRWIQIKTDTIHIYRCKDIGTGTHTWTHTHICVYPLVPPWYSVPPSTRESGRHLRRCFSTHRCAGCHRCRRRGRRWRRRHRRRTCAQRGQPMARWRSRISMSHLWHVGSRPMSNTNIARVAIPHSQMRYKYRKTPPCHKECHHSSVAHTHHAHTGSAAHVPKIKTHIHRYL
jgi:hypothetical protein